jgi:hypothetical protein
VSLSCSRCFGVDWALFFLKFDASWLISVAPPWLAVVLVTHVYFCAVSPFLGVVSVFLVLGASTALALAFLMGGSRISSQPPALDSRSSRLASRHLSGCSLWSSRSFKSQ